MVNLSVTKKKSIAITIGSVILGSAIIASDVQSVLPFLVNPVISAYCTIPSGAREAIRVVIDSKTAPNKLRIECYGETRE